MASRQCVKYEEIFNINSVTVSFNDFSQIIFLLCCLSFSAQTGINCDRDDCLQEWYCHIHQQSSWMDETTKGVLLKVLAQLMLHIMCLLVNFGISVPHTIFRPSVFCICLCLIYLLPLILLTTPFFCHIFVTLLVYLTLSLLGSLPILLIAPKLSL